MTYLDFEVKVVDNQPKDPGEETFRDADAVRRRRRLAS